MGKYCLMQKGNFFDRMSHVFIVLWTQIKTTNISLFSLIFDLSSNTNFITIWAIPNEWPRFETLTSFILKQVFLEYSLNLAPSGQLAFQLNTIIYMFLKKLYTIIEINFLDSIKFIYINILYFFFFR